MIYLDHAASTPMRPEAVAAMLPFLVDHPGNPSGSHGASRAAKTALEQAREDVADCVGRDARRVIFTGGGSESDNLAIKGVARARRTRGLDAVVTTTIEHKAVLGSVQRLAAEGFRVGYANALLDGSIDVDHLASLLDEHTAIISVMAVNNETGVVQPLDAVRDVMRVRAPQAVLHTDAVQAPQWLDLRPICEVADFVSISGHKFGGPKGVGALILGETTAVNTDLLPLIEGGGHELGFRAGTQNVAGIIAFATALTITDSRRTEETTRIAALRDRLETALTNNPVNGAVNGGPTGGSTGASYGTTVSRVAGLLHLAIPDVEAETMLVALDVAGVCAASGSACSSGAIDPSHVLIAMGLSRATALASVRFSLGWASTADDIGAAIPTIIEAVARLRSKAA